MPRTHHPAAASPVKDPMIDHFKSGWNIVKNGFVGWIVFGIVLLVLFSFGIGIFLWPNAFRAIRKASESQQGPSLGDLFNFDNIVDDAVAMIVYLVAIWIGSLFCGVGGVVAAVLLFWMPMLAADGKFAAVDNAKASLAHAKTIIGPIIVFFIVTWLINFCGALLCYIGVLVTFPLTIAAQWVFYTQYRHDILTTAQQAGVPTKP